MSKISELEARRDNLAGDLAALQMRLDALSGNEELTAVQKIVNDIDATTRLVAALDRQILQAREAARLAAIAARAAAEEAALHEITKLNGAMAAKLGPVYELAEQCVALAEVSPRLGARAGRLRQMVIALMEATGGYDLAAGVGTGVFPVKR